MAIYNYGIGGNEVKVDANESIAEIPSNRTLIVQKLTVIEIPDGHICSEDGLKSFW